MSTKREDFQNRALALLLRRQGLEADFEQRAGRRQIDAVVRVDWLRVMLEAETRFHRRAQAIKDADARLKQGVTVAAFAVCYPSGVTDWAATFRRSSRFSSTPSTSSAETRAGAGTVKDQ